MPATQAKASPVAKQYSEDQALACLAAGILQSAFEMYQCGDDVELQKLYLFALLYWNLYTREVAKIPHVRQVDYVRKEVESLLSQQRQASQSEAGK